MIESSCECEKVVNDILAKLSFNLESIGKNTQFKIYYTAIFLINGLCIVYCTLLQCLTLVYLGWGQKSEGFLPPSNYT